MHYRNASSGKSYLLGGKIQLGKGGREKIFQILVTCAAIRKRSAKAEFFSKYAMNYLIVVVLHLPIGLWMQRMQFGGGGVEK